MDPYRIKRRAERTAQTAMHTAAERMVKAKGPRSAKARAQGKPCPYCGSIMTGKMGKRGKPNKLQPTVDHIEPKVLGGSNGNGNRMIACRQCNEDKAGMALEVWHAILVRARDERAPLVAGVIAQIKV